MAERAPAEGWTLSVHYIAESKRAANMFTEFDDIVRREELKNKLADNSFACCHAWSPLCSFSHSDVTVQNLALNSERRAFLSLPVPL